MDIFGVYKIQFSFDFKIEYLVYDMITMFEFIVIKFSTIILCFNHAFWIYFMLCLLWSLYTTSCKCIVRHTL